MHGSTISEVWHQVIGTQPTAPLALVLVTGVLTLLVVAYGPVWRVARNAITIAHEGGHALVALLSGRRLTGIRLHSDTSGVTVSVGKPTGPGMVFTGLAGYIAPSLLGLGAAAMVTANRLTALLWLTLVLLLAMLIMIRNAYGVLTVVVTGVVLFVISWFTSPTVQAAAAYLITWFLLLGGLRPIFELQTKRSRRQAPSSDADQLHRLTGVPGIVWVVVFFLVAAGCLVVGGYWLVPELPSIAAGFGAAG
ncbi:M50 family metallopeptidase [Actinocatenispora comari]|uniref:Membrane protein n=1 Tax=Actinocatenispora comari TaxID=2807577 RepID=A0A8J4EIU1_9ACTN|nr:M50 family metallopeptidase [Actinocatenispora comari]GIL26422.1 membrane protein [Actinocatenispora comari]